MASGGPLAFTDVPSPPLPAQQRIRNGGTLLSFGGQPYWEDTSGNLWALTPGGSSAVPWSQAAFSAQGAGGLAYLATDNGLACDDATDDTNALIALLIAVTNAGGGTIFFPSLALIDGQVNLPATIVTQSGGFEPGPQLRQAPIRLLGTVTNRPGNVESGVPFPSGGLDLRYAGRADTGCGTTLGSNIVTDPAAVSGDYGQIILCPGVLPDRTYIMGVTPGVGYSLNNGARVTNASATFTVGGGKIQATGLGTLELDHMLLCDQGSSSQPFIVHTGTTIHMHDSAVWGNNSKGSGTCDQDIIVAGGPGHGTTLTSPLVSGNVYTSLAVAALPIPMLVQSAPDVVITNGTGTQAVITGAAAAGATTITVTSFTANANYPAGSAVLLGNAQGTGNNALTVPAANFQGYGTHLHDNYFDRVRRICLQNWVDDYYVDTNVWWQECGSNLAAALSTLTSGLTVAGGPYTALAVTALPMAVAAGDQIQLGTGNPGSANSKVVTASGIASAGATSIPVNSFTPNQAYPSGTIAVNVTAGIGAALEVYGAVGAVSQVNASHNRFELSGAYSYATRFDGQVNAAVLVGNNINDYNPTHVIAAHRFGAHADYNLVIPGLNVASAVPLLDDQTVNALFGNQSVFTALNGQPTLMPRGMYISGRYSKYLDGYEPIAVDTFGSAYQTRVSGQSSGTIGSWFWNFTPVGGSGVDMMRLEYINASLYELYLNTATGGTTFINNNNGLITISSGAGYQLTLGDTTRASDVAIQNGNLLVVHLLSQAGIGGAAPTVAAASASTGLSIAGTDTAHNVQLTTAASISAGASVATVTFNLSYATRVPSKNPRLAVTPKNLASALAQPYITGDGQAGYSIALAVPPALATALAFDVCVIAS